MEYKKVKLGEVVTLQRGFDLPQQKRSPGKYPIIAATGITGYHSSYKVKGPGITTGRSGSLGTVIWEDKDFWPLNTTLYVKDFHNNDPKYVYYFLQKFPFDKYNSGSGVPTLNRNHINQVEVQIPPLSSQHRIANILSSFDNKIEQLKKENNILEDIAQNIFKEWFVKYNFTNKDGKPYRDNNGKMIDSELGLIPEGWRVEKLGDIGIRITEKVQARDNNIVLSAINSGELVKSDDFFEKRVYSKSLSKYIKCTIDDFAYNPARINIGSIGKNKFANHGCVSPVYIVFRPKSRFCNWLEFVIKSKTFKKYVELASNGSVRQSLSYDSFTRFICVIPEISILEKFNVKFLLIKNSINSNNSEINILTALRNNLLRLLIGN